MHYKSEFVHVSFHHFVIRIKICRVVTIPIAIIVAFAYISTCNASVAKTIKEEQ